MDNDYLIIDTRIIDDFKKTTFSGYKKKMFLSSYLRVLKQRK